MNSKIEGIPHGWELVRIGRAAIGEFQLSHKGEPKEVLDEEYCGLDCVIIRKIEKVKRYRQFANAQEFMAHPLASDWIDCGAETFAKVLECDDDGVWLTVLREMYFFKDAFSNLQFRDGTPFGVEVTEEDGGCDE